MTAKLEDIAGGQRGLVVDALRGLADELERGGEGLPVGYAVVIVRSDGGATVRWAGNELRTVGALEYAKHAVLAVWRDESERDLDPR